MRLLIVEHNFSTGTETVNLGIIPELTRLVECVVWVLPDYRSEFYKRVISPSDQLIYEGLSWPRKFRFFYHSDGMLGRLNSLLPANWTFAVKTISWMRGQIANAWLRYLIRKYRITHFFTTWIFNQESPKLPVPIGAMVMDLNWQHFPENFPYNDRRTLDRLFASWLRRADVIFPISDFTAEEIRGAFPQTASRVAVVPHGARTLSPELSGAAPRRHRAQERPRFYYPASVFSHKDHKTLIQAAITLFAKGYDFDLVCSGNRTECFLHQSSRSDSLSESIRKLCSENSTLINGRVKCLGSVDRAEVEALYDEARAVILPSRFEGFGLPLLEAIERGRRVICTDIPPFNEQIRRYDYGDYTRLFPPGSATSLAECMVASLKSSGMDQPLPGEIAARTQRWTWKDAAVAYIDAMSEARNGSPQL
jgi:glycosyltransferase involved in cell wall biosynthesis